MQNTPQNHADAAERARRNGNAAKAQRHAELADEYAIGNTTDEADDAAHDAEHSARLARTGHPNNPEADADDHEAEAREHDAQGNHAAARSHARQARRARNHQRRADQP